MRLGRGCKDHVTIISRFTGENSLTDKRVLEPNEDLDILVLAYSFDVSVWPQESSQLVLKYPSQVNEGHNFRSFSPGRPKCELGNET